MSAEVTRKQTMTCAEFQERLPELFESGADLHTEAHLQGCEQCASLVSDLEYIAQQAKLLLPIHEPSPAVWEGIQSTLGDKKKSSATGAR